MKIRILFLIHFVLLSVNCSWPKVADNQNVEQSLNGALSSASQEVSRLSEELTRARAVQARLEVVKPRDWTTKRTLASDLLRQAEESFQSLKRRNEEFRAQRADFAAFAHSHPKVYDRDPAWSQALNWQKTIKAATDNFNFQLNETSTAIKRLYDLWVENKFYQRHDTTEVAARWSGEAVAWQAELSELKTYYEAGQNRLKSWYDRQPAGQSTAARLSPLSDLNHDLIEMTDLFNRLESLRREYANQFGHQDEISNLDSQWTNWVDIQRRQALLIGRLQTAKGRATEAYARLLKAEEPRAQAQSGEDQKQSPQ